MSAEASYPKELLCADEKVMYDAIVVGAGVVGPCVATALARKGKKVLIVEREWSQPDRIVGELMQPAGVRALRSLGMVQAINNIDACSTSGYTVIYNGEKISFPYPYKADSRPPEKIPDLVFDGNDKVVDDGTISVKEFEEDEREHGVGFVHGRFLQNLRAICAAEERVTRLQGNVVSILRNDSKEVIGTKVDVPGRGKVDFKAHMTFVCDGIFSRFRRELSTSNTSKVWSSFVGLSLHNADLPTKHHGHVILGTDHMPIIAYQISSTETRILCAYNYPTLPKNIPEWLQKEVQPFIPPSLRKSFDAALESRTFKCMPNSWLPASQNTVTGLCVVGDALNMRHPLTGGGMAVGLMDVVLLVKTIGDMDFADREEVLNELLGFHYERKAHACVINTLSIALYSLFAADSYYLKKLQKGCFEYLGRGEEWVRQPISFLSGVLASPYLLTKVFFTVALYSVLINFRGRTPLGFLLAIFEGFAIIFTAAKVFTPFLYEQLLG
ncbi:AaceriAAL141Cp [[Ashbya] aceris (nom. inval.)]|nr:AaceriAAL141Cp [[Ashbya] aceris (nom. inval.)]